MATQWFVDRQGKKIGPLSSSQLKQLAKDGKISGGTKVLRGDKSAWVAAGTIKGLFPEDQSVATSSEPSIDEIMEEISKEKQESLRCKYCGVPTTNHALECDSCVEIRESSSTSAVGAKTRRNVSLDDGKFWTLDIKLKALSVLAFMIAVPVLFWLSGAGNVGSSVQSRIKSQFSPWDGSHINLTKYIKSTMNDPDSYEHVSTYWDQKADHLIVNTTFRGKNIFGGVVKNGVTAKVDFSGEIIEILMTLP